MRQSTLFVGLFFWATCLSGQTAGILEAQFLRERPELDGRLTDSCWQLVYPLEAFTTAYPVFGTKPECRTEARLFYTSTGIYVAACCYDADSAGVRSDRGLRDEAQTGDWFRISLDTWNDDRLAFAFTVSAAGVQLDSRHGDEHWDAFWESAAIQQAGGWTLEVFIPFSALRFPKKSRQDWGLQLSRYDRSSGELSTWSPQDPLVTDQVVQFGTLTGLHNIRQDQRKQLSLYSASDLDTRKYYTNRNQFTQTAGVDGRLGLGSQATLDFTILPPLALSTTWNRNEKDEPFFFTATPPSPRQFIAEEGDLFRKNRSFDPNPYQPAYLFSWRHPLQPGEVFTKYYNGKLIHATKITARTRGNLRLGGYTALLSPTHADVRNLASPIVAYDRVRLQGISNTSFLAAEYVLPNNGFVHLSSAARLAGRDMQTHAPLLQFSVRDRSNTLDMSGAAQLVHQNIDTVSFNSGSYSYSISRLNRRLGFVLSHVGYYEEPNPLPVFPGGRLQRFNRSAARVLFRSFDPGGLFVNRSSALGVELQWPDAAGQQKDWYLAGSFSGLDYQLRTYSANLSVQPQSRLIRYESSTPGSPGGPYLYQEVAPFVRAGLSFQSDYRRRLRYAIEANGSGSVKGEFPDLQIRVVPEWVVSNWVRLSGDFGYAGAYRQLQLLAVPGRWVFEQYDLVRAWGKVRFSWYPVQRLGVFTSIGVSGQAAHRRRAVELAVGGDLVPVDLALDDRPSTVDKEYTFGVRYFFSSVSQLRFDYTVGGTNSIQVLPLPTSLKADKPLQANLTLIWVLNNPKIR